MTPIKTSETPSNRDLTPVEVDPGGTRAVHLQEFTRSDGALAIYPNNGAFVFGTMVRELTELYRGVVERLTFVEADALISRLTMGNHADALDVLRQRMTVDELATEKEFLAERMKVYIEDYMALSHGAMQRVANLAISAAFDLLWKSVGLL